MTHAWHDAYRHASTPAHHLDPRSKLLVGLFFVGVVLFAPRFAPSQIVGYLLLIAATAALARLSWRSLGLRAVSLLPFALLMLLSAVISRLSREHLSTVLTRAVLSILAMALVGMTTPFPDFLRALEQLRLPKTMVMFLGFVYRYAAVLQEEAVQLQRGWSARYFGRRWFDQLRRLGHVLAALFLRSYERAERVYAAMLARGFSQKTPLIRLLHFGPSDLFFAGISATAIAWIRWGRL